jgi:MFS family permease
VGYAYLYTAYSPALIGLIVFCLPIGRGVAFALMGKVRVSQMLNLVPFLCLLAMILVFSVPSVANLSILILIFIITGFISGFAFSGSFYIVTGLSKERRGLFVGLLESTVGVSLATSTFVPFLILGNDPLSPFIFVLYVMGILAGLFFLIRLVLYFRLKISN